MDGKWLSVLEFAAYKKKSISTVRRYIKANRVKYKEEAGKYFVWTKNYIPSQTSQEEDFLKLKFELERMKKENIELKDELAQTKTLIELYEAGHVLPKSSVSDLPILPELPLNF